MTNPQEELKRLDGKRPVNPAYQNAFDEKFGRDYRVIALELSKSLTASEEALGLCVEGMPIEAVELIEALESLVAWLTPDERETAKYVNAVNEARLAYLRRKEG